MKFIHIADMHFDSPFANLADKKTLGEKRRLEQRKIFKKIIDHIKENKIEYFFISGDLYEHKYIKTTTIEYINNLFKEIPETKIFIAPGNHDPNVKNSYYNRFNWNKNVKIFKGEIEKIETKDAIIYGYGFDDFYCTNSGIENMVIEKSNKPKILIIHGTLDGANIEEKQYNSISTKTLEEKGFNYVALGHIHKTNHEQSIKYIYPGSTIALGFDELGEHGMIEGEIDLEKASEEEIKNESIKMEFIELNEEKVGGEEIKNESIKMEFIELNEEKVGGEEIKKQNIKIKFIELDDEKFTKKEIDVTEISSKEELIEKINSTKINENEYVEIILEGKRNFEINKYSILKYIENERIIKIKDETKIAYDLEKIAKDTTLKGIFVREMLKKYNEAEITNEEKEIIEKAIEIGFEALA